MSSFLGSIQNEYCQVNFWKRKKAIWLEYHFLNPTIAGIFTNSQPGFFSYKGQYFRQIDALVLVNKNISAESIGLSLFNTKALWPTHLGIDYRWVGLQNGEYYWLLPGQSPNNDMTILKSMVWLSSQNHVPDHWSLTQGLQSFYKSKKLKGNFVSVLLQKHKKGKKKPIRRFLWTVIVSIVLFTCIFTWTKPMPVSVQVPSVLGSSPQQAENKLHRLGLKVKVDYPDFPIVSQQSPGPGSLVKQDAIIVLKTRPGL